MLSVTDATRSLLTFRIFEFKDAVVYCGGRRCFMAVVAFDTLKLADRLQAGGFTADQARAAAGAFADAMSGSDLATEARVIQEASSIRSELAQEASSIRSELAQEASSIRAELAQEASSIRSELAQEACSIRAELAQATHRLERQICDVAARVERQEAVLSERIERQGSVLSERIERRVAESDAKTLAIKNDLIRWVLGVGIASILTIIGAAWTIIRYLPPHP